MWALHVFNYGPEEPGGRLRRYPNPATVIVNIKGVTGQNATIEILDVTGKQVKFENIANGNTAINLDGLVEGIYLYQIKKLNGEIERTGKLMVNL